MFLYNPFNSSRFLSVCPQEKVVLRKHEMQDIKDRRPQGFFQGWTNSLFSNSRVLFKIIAESLPRYRYVRRVIIWGLEYIGWIKSWIFLRLTTSFYNNTCIMCLKWLHWSFISTSRIVILLVYSNETWSSILNDLVNVNIKKERKDKNMPNVLFASHRISPWNAKKWCKVDVRLMSSISLLSYTTCVLRKIVIITAINFRLWQK